MEEGQPSLPRHSVSVKTIVKMYFCLYERRANTPWLDLDIEILPRRAGNFPYTATQTHSYRCYGIVH